MQTKKKKLLEVIPASRLDVGRYTKRNINKRTNVSNALGGGCLRVNNSNKCIGQSDANEFVARLR